MPSVSMFQEYRKGQVDAPFNDGLLCPFFNVVLEIVRL